MGMAVLTDKEACNRRMLRARDAMDRTFAEPLCIPRLAEIAEVSEAHFIRTFRATFGETPHRYLQRRRVERAMFLLRATERSVTDICFDTGFSSLGTFSRTFHDIVGIADSLPPERTHPGGPDLLPDGVGATEQFWRSALRCSHARVTYMLNAIHISHVFVADQDKALEFYVGKLGLEVSNDQDLGFMRWLT